MRRSIPLAASLALTVALAAPVALAQSSSWYSSVYQGYSNNRMLYSRRAAVSSSVRRSAGRRGGASAGSASRNNRGTQGAAKPVFRTGGTTFLPVAPSLVPEQLAESLAKTPAEREQMLRTFKEMLDIYKDVARRSGALPNDVARATAYMVNSSYHVYTDGRGMTDRQFAAMRDMIRQSLTQDQIFQRRTMREKQQIFEDFAISGSFVMFAYQAAQRSGNKAALAEAREIARQNIQQALGAPVEGVRFTDAGVEF